LNEDFRENPNQIKNVDSNNNVNTKLVVTLVCLIVLIDVGVYFFNFHYRLSEKNEVWGTFGDCFGGILNPVIPAFAFYLIAKTYELKKGIRSDKKFIRSINQCAKAAN
jgi:large-conductance mechanosensitive channel